MVPRVSARTGGWLGFGEHRGNGADTTTNYFDWPVFWFCLWGKRLDCRSLACAHVAANFIVLSRVRERKSETFDMSVRRGSARPCESPLYDADTATYCHAIKASWASLHDRLRGVYSYEAIMTSIFALTGRQQQSTCRCVLEGPAGLALGKPIPNHHRTDQAIRKGSPQPRYCPGTCTASAL